ncbi:MULTISPECIES: hypothetical protein [unclassified Streptomyces]|uniref:hypothetical protein n=1 Tax=unclassified Streptomyces TaxID=2593676 RepID=UPI00224D2283|nr:MULTISPECIES: hypothetical protein [unclassified Streptomyces]MCX4527895.1 hypothetical protein [Streptomyces sp. NBC_01551]MCX4541508.1 hypothetical protein [Streptomyces sp. NBC_01565]
MSQSDHSRQRRRRPARKAAGLLVLLALVGYLSVQYASNEGGGAPHCTASVVTGADEAGQGGTRESFDMSPEQAANAATIAAVGVSKGLPDRAVTIALATAMQESALRNLDHGDRDSLGLFQQRPSMGWGTPDEIRDPVYSSGIFYDHLVKVPGYSRLPLTVAAQKVQRSGYPQAYAKHEPDAMVLTAAFGGRGSLTCGGPAPTEPGDPEKVREQLVRIFGKKVLATGGGGAPATTADAGRGVKEAEINLPLKPEGDEAEHRRGKALAHWAVANSRNLGIARVSYSAQGWVAGEAKGAWQDKGGAGASGGDPYGADANEVRIFVAQ